VKNKIRDLSKKALDQYKKGNFDLAEEIYNKILKVDQESFLSYYNIGIIKFYKKDYKKSEDMLIKAFKLNNTSEKYFSAVIDILLTQNKNEKCKNFIKENSKNFNAKIISISEEKIKHQNLLNEIINSYNGYENLNNSEIKKLLSKARLFNKKYKKNSVGLKFLAAILIKMENKKIKRKRNFSEIINLLEESYSINKNDLNVIFMLAGQYMDNSLTERAIGLYSLSSKYFPEEHLIYFNKGNANIVMGNTERAIEDYLKAIELKSNDYDSHLNLAKAYKDINDLENSYKIYKKMIDLDSNNASGFRGLGAVSILIGKLSDAEKYIKKSIKLDPENDDAKQNLSICFLRLGKLEEGVNFSQKNVGAIKFKNNKELGNFKVF
tara:strand:- start:28082 stop:29221 length:1140 start_codon:yes stop_codon:yes gene_type:complete